MHEHVAPVKKNRMWDRPRTSRNTTIDGITEFWCEYCLKCDAPIYDTIRVDRMPAPRYSQGIHFTCQDPDNHKYAHTYCDMGEPECLSCGQFLGCTNKVVQNHLNAWQEERDSYVRNNPLPSPDTFANNEEYKAAVEEWDRKAPREGDYGTIYGENPFAPKFRGTRAHVTAYSFTQDSRPENIIPLCDICHGADPSFADRREYLDWILDRRAVKAENMESFLERIKASKIINSIELDTPLNSFVIAINILKEKPLVDPLQPVGGRARVAQIEDVIINHMPEIEARRAQLSADESRKTRSE